MRLLAALAILFTALLAAAPAPAADITRVELHQREEVMQQQQRFVGNLRAQAQREGIVVKVPQLFVYFTDRSGAWHLQGYRRGFERTLGLTYEHGRRERSMVNLERLLDRTITPGGEAYTHEDLPEADLYLLLYRREGCADCEQVASSLDAWLEGRENLEALWFDIWVDRHEAD
ncbi:hypothetical protein [Wenzhouxiangella sp. EGI_FJ10409]|uniref:hypothetical protein n=1 Tax=Wenzhouxiangella sp. EGI_FJ10409 TaxID=3243767 RepID=UPI0035DE9CD7